MKEIMKRTKGITLIALVVTIVVLLILAGVSINLVIGQNGIITRAGDAKDATKYSNIKDEYEMYKTNKYLESATGGTGGQSFSEFLQDLKNRGMLTDEDIAQINSENKLTISDKYEISFAKTLVDAFKDGDIKVGDYLNYSTKLNTTATYTSTANENGWADQTYSVDTATQWRVLGLSEDGKQLLLVSADPIQKNMDASSTDTWNQNPYLYTKGAYSYVNCNTMLNNICGIYSSSLGTARSMTIEDINNILGVKVESDKVYFESDSSKTNIDESVNNGGLGLGQTYTYKSTDYSPESYVNGKSNATEGETVTQDGYWYDYTGLMNTTIGSTTIGNLLFDGTLSDSNYAKSYWLASPGAFVVSSRAIFGPGRVDLGPAGPGCDFFLSNGFWNAFRLAVRPVVSLNSDVTVDQLEKITGSTTTWTYDNNNAVGGSGQADTGEAGIIIQ